MAKHRSLTELLENAARIAGMESPTPLYINEHEASQVTGHSVASLRKRRLQGKAPCFYKIGSLVRYNYFDLFDWMNSCVRTSTTQKAEG